MPKVTLSHHGTIDGSCTGSKRTTRARVRTHERTIIGSGGKRVTRKRESAWCRWCQTWTGFERKDEPKCD